jgi:hypothetical protein
VTAIVGVSDPLGNGQRPELDLRFSDPSTAFLPDAGSGIFDPGWDVSFSGNSQADFFASYGLGNPFPEDAKLCAALNSFWPSVAPDATRTFGLFPPRWQATTSAPLMDDELGVHPKHPLVAAGKRKSSVGWDGEYGPFFERGFRFVNHANIAQSDYVTHALNGHISILDLGNISAQEFLLRMEAIRNCVRALPPSPKRVSATRLFLVSAERIQNWAARSDRGDPRLSGEGYLFLFAILDEAAIPAREHGRLRRKIKERYTCQIGSRGVCWRREARNEPFKFVPAPV